MALDKKNHLLGLAGKILIFIFSHTYGFIIGPLVVFGSIFCMAYFEPWPLKLIFMALWNTVLYFLAKVVNQLAKKNLD